MTMIEDAERYVGLKQYVGFSYRSQSWVVRQYARYATHQGDQFVRSARVIEWAAKTSSVHFAREKLRQLRDFALWLRAEDERHEVPPRHAFGRPARVRPSPYILTSTEIRRLMEAALALPPAGTITPHTFHFAIGLIASTGMRCSEAASLRLADITPDGLIIRETKYRKSRLLVLHESAWEALDRYLELRIRYGATDDHLLILWTGKPPTKEYLSDMFRKLARKTGLREKNGKLGPRLHSLRHTFAVRALERADLPDRDSVNRHMLALSTYLGHSSVAHTYWYLEATPALLKSIASAAEDAFTGRASQ